MNHISSAPPSPRPARRHPPLPLGDVGRVVIFFWIVAVMMLAPARMLPGVTFLCLGLALLAYRSPLARWLRIRRLALLALLALPPLFLVGSSDRHLWGMPYSSQGAMASMQIALRFLAMMAAIDGFTATVEIATLAGLFERLGLKGLGFSLGVAFNLLPALRQSGMNAWRSLRMRGGFRRHRRQALQNLLMTIITGALRRSEEISLAAEARAFSPERTRPLPLERGRADPYLLLLLPITLGLMLWAYFS